MLLTISDCFAKSTSTGRGDLRNAGARDKKRKVWRFFGALFRETLLWAFSKTQRTFCSFRGSTNEKKKNYCPQATHPKTRAKTKTAQKLLCRTESNVIVGTRRFLGSQFVSGSQEPKCREKRFCVQRVGGAYIHCFHRELADVFL